MLSYSWVSMVCANCMMSHTPAVNGNISSYRNVPDNVNCVCGWLISPHRTLCTVQVICANWIRCCTAAVSGNIFSCWDAPDNLVCSSQTFFLSKKRIFEWWHFAVSIAYCVLFPLFWMFSHAVFWKLDLFLMSDARNGSSHSVHIASFISYTRPFPKCYAWKM
jgi:hypothetical protein